MEAHFVEEKRDAAGRRDYDGWPIGTGWRYPQPRTLAERKRHALDFREKFGFPAELEFVLDPIDNCFNRRFAAWPDSAYVVSRGRLVYRSQLDEQGIRSASFAVHIEQLLSE